MTDETLDKKFTEAFNKISELKTKLPEDIMLRFYAYYKQAKIGDNFSYNASRDIRSAFKFNAWIQLRGMSAKKAKKEYIKLAKTILNTTL